MNVAVIGLGLIGGSLLQALARAGHQVRGYDANPATQAAAHRAAASAPSSARWRVASSVQDAVAHADLVVVAVPPPAAPAVFDELATIGYPGLVTDVTSVKDPIRALVEERQREHRRIGRFVGGHPMAGRERSGFAAADPALFTGCAWVLCLDSSVTALADWLDLAAVLTSSLQARVVPATAAEHDRAVAAVSHVPHLLAAALAARAGADPLAITLGAGSFRDGTRVAATSPDFVAAMCGGNAPAVRSALDAVLDALREARAALDTADPVAALRPWLAPGHAVRSNWPPSPGAAEELPADIEALLDLGRAGGWVTAVAADRRTVTAVRPAPRR